MVKRTTVPSAMQMALSCAVHKKIRRLASLRTRFVVFVSTNTIISLNELAEKLLEQMTELNSKYTVLQKNGLPLKMEGRSKELFETLFARMKELPVQVDKAAAAGMEKSIKKLDDEITKIRNCCIIGTIVVNVLFAFLALVLFI